MNKIFKEWLFECFKAIPLIIAIIIIATKDFMIAVGCFIIILYIVHLYDLKWQKKQDAKYTEREIKESKYTSQFISRKTVQLYKQRISKI